MAAIDLLVVTIYMIGMVGIGLWAQRKASTQEEFLVAGRRVGPLLYSGTLAAIIIGGGATVGGVKLGFQYGISGMWFVSMYGLGMIVMAVLLVPRILQLKLYTIPELLERRYSKAARVAGGAVMAAYDFMIVVTATIAIGAVAEVILGLPRTPAILISSAVMVTYSVLGGMWALTATDIAQFLIKTVGIMFILLPLSIIRAGGIGQMHAHLPPGYFNFTSIGWVKILSFFTLYFLGILIGQDGWQRVFTARSVGVARTGGILVGLYCIAYAVTGALIGAAGRVFLPPLADSDLAFATIVNAVLPMGLRGLVLAASLAAIMSTATACLLASSTVLLEDVYLVLRPSGDTGSLRQSRMLTFVLGVLAAAIACVSSDVLAALNVGYDLLVGALFIPILCAILIPSSSAIAALAAITSAAIVVVAMLLLKGIDSVAPLYGGLATSAAIIITLNLWIRHVGGRAVRPSPYP